MDIYAYLNEYFYILKLTDFLEILFFSFCFYKFISWLSKDSSKNLAFLFFVYCFVFITTGFFKIETLHTFLFNYSPVFLTLFVILHQTIIQKNFVVSKKIKPAKSDDSSWVMDLLKSVVISMSRNTDLVCMIECSDSVHQYVKDGIAIGASVSKEFLNLIFGSLEFDNQKIVYFNSEGFLKSINSDLKFGSNLDEQISIITEKSDVLFLKSDSSLRSMEIILQNKSMKDLNIEKALDIILHYLKTVKVGKIKSESSLNDLSFIKKEKIKGAHITK